MKIITLQQKNLNYFKEVHAYPLYQIISISQGKGVIQLDQAQFDFVAPVIIFSSPFQEIQIHSSSIENQKASILQFHGDYYCIEYHKNEVACNGILFNNAYLSPFIEIDAIAFKEFEVFFQLLDYEINQNISDEESIIIAYLQVILAKASAAKKTLLQGHTLSLHPKDEMIEHFKKLMDENYLKERKASYYAEKLHTSINNLNKLSQAYFGKSTTQLIQERLILEAKKQLHLSNQSIKQIARNLNFNDELYFSRFFKKLVKIAPQKFREETGVVLINEKFH